MSERRSTQGRDSADDTKRWMARRNADVRGRVGGAAPPMGPSMAIKSVRRLSPRPTGASGRAGLINTLEDGLEAPQVALAAGLVPGALRGALHIAKSVGQVARLATDPLGTSFQVVERLQPGRLASETRTAGHVASHLADDVTHPLATARRQITRVKRDLIPGATPKANTRQEEFQRNFKIGENWGELGLNIGLIAAGGPATEALEAATAAKRATTVAEFMQMGQSATRAKQLAELSRGEGSHYISKNMLRKLHIPDWYGNSGWNVLKPHGINKGDFYKLHYEVDRFMKGARMPGPRGTPGWSGKKLGLRKHGLVGRVVVGAPTRVKGTAGGVAAAAVGASGNGHNGKFG